MDQFYNTLRLKYIFLDFDGTPDSNSDIRSHFLGHDGRKAPIRGIVKAFGTTDDTLRAKDARRILRDMISLQQLGIINLDPQYWQFVSDKFCDFSSALTTPHFMMNPELSPFIAPEWIPRMEFDTFRVSVHDFWTFDGMVERWNTDNPKDKISVSAFPGDNGCRSRYNLRSTPAGECVYSFVDPRRYDWRPSATVKANRGAQGLSRGIISKPRRQLVSRPSRWIYSCGPRWAEEFMRCRSASQVVWEYKNGRISPCEPSKPPARPRPSGELVTK